MSISINLGSLNWKVLLIFVHSCIYIFQTYIFQYIDWNLLSKSILLDVLCFSFILEQKYVYSFHNKYQYWNWSYSCRSNNESFCEMDPDNWCTGNAKIFSKSVSTFLYTINGNSSIFEKEFVSNRKSTVCYIFLMDLH